MRIRIWSAVLLAAMLAIAPARAAIYNWSYSDPNRSGSGTLTVSGGASPFNIIDISGNFAGQGITQLITDQSCCGAPGPDNLLFTGGGPLLSGNGFAFITFGPGFYDIAFINGSYAVLDGNGLFTSNGTFTATLVPGVGPIPVSAPAALGLLALGLGGLITLRRAGA